MIAGHMFHPLACQRLVPTALPAYLADDATICMGFG
jgi:hypothetical protein